MRDSEDEFLDALYLGVRRKGDFDQALMLLAREFDCPTVTLVDADALQPAKTLTNAAGLDPAAMKLYNETYGVMDPAPSAYFKACPVGHAATTNEILGPQEITHGIFYNEYFREIGYEETLGGTLAASAGRFAVVAVLRTPTQRPFDTSDKTKLERLMPHLIRALELRRSFLALERKGDLLSEACDRLAAGVVAVDEEGRVVYVNEAARRMSERNDGFGLSRQGQPFAVDRDANRELSALRCGLADGCAGGHLRVPRRNGGAAYLVSVAPLFLAEEYDSGNRRPRGVLYIIHDPLDLTPSAPELLATLFGLTKAAAAVVAALVSGEDLKDYAERAGISMNTVNFHLKTAFDRTGLRKQADLVRAATAALRDLLDRRSASK